MWEGKSKFQLLLSQVEILSQCQLDGIECLLSVDGIECHSHVFAL